MIIGYIRVSTYDQNLDLQKDALNHAGCERIFEDQVSGSKSVRPGLDQMMEVVRQGDTIVVWRLDRLGRSLKHLIELVTHFEQNQIGLKSLQESIDTTTPSGKLIFHIFGALAEFERHLIRERTNAGLRAARARGRKGGRPESLDSQKRQVVVNLYNSKEHSVTEICQMMGISKPTLYKYVGQGRK